MSVHRSKYAAVVVGAGPAGICAVGNLLERGLGPILWVDVEFNGGRFNHLYREVPSNTKVKLFIDFAEALGSFRNIVQSTPSPNAVDKLRGLAQDKGTQLADAADVLLMLTKGLIQIPGVESRRGRVEEASIDANNAWHVSITLKGTVTSLEEPTRVISDRLILCTGSSPAQQTSLPVETETAGLQTLHLDTALSPAQLGPYLPFAPTLVAVVGASHSAILVLMNLSRMAQTSHPDLKIKWFARHSLRYAEFMDGWTLRDNTGLKGEVAQWAKNNLEPERFKDSPVSACVTPIAYDMVHESETFEEHLTGCDYIVQAIGYRRDPLPRLKRGVGTIEVDYDRLTGAFLDMGQNGEKIPGLYGAGIAFPEKVTDPHGNVEYAVGMWKFMRYMKRVSCDWN